MDTLETEEILEPLTGNTSNWFVDDNYYREHPENILGTPYEASGRFGPVTKYKGDITAIDRIEAPTDFIGMNRTLNNPLLSTGDDVNISAKITRPDVADFVKSVITKADQQAGAKLGRKKPGRVEGDVLLVEAPQLQTFDDVWRTYNPNISRGELEVFIWYKTQQGKPLSRQWVNLLQPGRYKDNLSHTAAYDVEPEVVLEWIKTGLAFYYAGKVIPAAEYLSGNMYDKKMQFAADEGQEILDTIEGLQILADDGDTEAMDTIEGLKLLLED